MKREINPHTPTLSETENHSQQENASYSHFVYWGVEVVKMMKKAKRIQRHIKEDGPAPFWQTLYDIDQLEALMQGTARSGKPISYSEALDCLGFAFSRPKMRALCVALGEVDRRARARNQPELAVLVVRASDLIPGQGWWVEKNDPQYKGPWEGPRAAKYIKDIQGRAFAYWKNR